MECENYSDTSSSCSSCSSSSDGAGPAGGHRLIDSTSFTVPGNPRGTQPEPRLTPYSEPLAPIPRKRSLVQQEVHAEPVSRCSGRGTPARREKGAQTPGVRRDRKGTDFRLPDILQHESLRSDEILAGLSRDGLVPESRFIRHTRSGIAYHFMYGPPAARPPRRLPRIVSEGAVMPHPGDRMCLLDELLLQEGRAAAGSPCRQLKQKRYCSGGRFTEDIRRAAITRRHQRELRNTERLLGQLQAHTDKVAMTAPPRGQRSATPSEVRAARVEEVRAKQDAIRQQEARRAVENFMKHKHKRH